MTGPWQATRPACAASTSASAARGRLLVARGPARHYRGPGGVAVARDTGIAVGYLPGGVDAAHRRPDARDCQDQQA